MAEATHLTCTLWVKNFDEQCRLFGPAGFGFPVARAFGAPGGLQGRYHQTGAGFIEVVENPPDPGPWWDFIMSVDDVPGWRQRLLGQGYVAGEITPEPGDRIGFAGVSPNGARFRVRSLGGGSDAPLQYAKDPQGPNVLHYVISWWPQDWEAEYRFLTEGFGLITSRGRSQPGRRIAFTRAAYGGRGILEVFDKQNDPYPGNGVHMRLALMVDDATAFHKRVTSAGFAPTPVERAPQGWLAFTVGTSAGPEVYVAEIPEGTMPGLLGEPLGLSMG